SIRNTESDMADERLETRIRTNPCESRTQDQIVERRRPLAFCPLEPHQRSLCVSKAAVNDREIERRHVAFLRPSRELVDQSAASTVAASDTSDVVGAYGCPRRFVS